MARLNSWLGTQRFWLVWSVQKWQSCRRATSNMRNGQESWSQRTYSGLRLPCQGSWNSFSLFPRQRLLSGTSNCWGNFFVLPLGTVFKKLPRVCIWHKLGCYCQVPKPYNYSVQTIDSGYCTASQRTNEVSGSWLWSKRHKPAAPQVKEIYSDRGHSSRGTI